MEPTTSGERFRKLGVDHPFHHPGWWKGWSTPLPPQPPTPMIRYSWFLKRCIWPPRKWLHTTYYLKKKAFFNHIERPAWPWSISIFDKYIYWIFQAVPGQSVDIITSPEQTELLGVWLEEQGITWSVGIEDVGVLIEDEKVIFDLLLLKHQLDLSSPDVTSRWWADWEWAQTLNGLD